MAAEHLRIPLRNHPLDTTPPSSPRNSCASISSSLLIQYQTIPIGTSNERFSLRSPRRSHSRAQHFDNAPSGVVVKVPILLSERPRQSISAASGAASGEPEAV